jgi:hypothetical protein
MEEGKKDYIERGFELCSKYLYFAFLRLTRTYAGQFHGHSPPCMLNYLRLHR